MMDVIIEWGRDELGMRNKRLVRARDEGLRRQARAEDSYDPLPLLLARRLKLNAAELEFIQEFRSELDAWRKQRQSEGEPSARVDERGRFKTLRGSVRRLVPQSSRYRRR